MMFLKKLLVIAIAVFMLTFCYINLSSHWPALLNSYGNSFTQSQVKNVIHNQKLHKDGRNIFFHETSKTVDGMIKVNSRQACAIESAAKVNPEHEVFVLFTSPVGFKDQAPSSLFNALLSYPNINFNYLNLTDYAKDTPLEDWIKTGKLEASKYVISHTSDILRYLTLFKFSGTYLDLDTITLKPFTLKNFAGAETRNSIAAGIINFDGTDGHEIAKLCLYDLLRHFNGSDWGTNGPGVITRVLKTLCKTEKVSKMISTGHCGPFRVLPVDQCYAINWNDYHKFFDPNLASKTLNLLKDSLITHFWNKFTSKLKLTVDSNGAYIKLARRYCPKVIEASTDF